jgi:hypothetical protein
MAGVVEQIAGIEGVGAVGDDVVAGDEIERVGPRQLPGMRLDGDLRIETAHGVGRALDLEAAEVLGAVQHLPLQIGQVDAVVIDDAERADARRGEIEEEGRAQPARAHHQHPRFEEALLPDPADLRQDDVAGIALKLGVGEVHGGRIGRVGLPQHPPP